VTSRLLPALATLLASMSAIAQMSDCEAECERIYKYCMTNQRETPNQCMTSLEICRKSCLKTQ
jgi:hypothetical protein